MDAFRGLQGLRLVSFLEGLCYMERFGAVSMHLGARWKPYCGIVNNLGGPLAISEAPLGAVCCHLGRPGNSPGAQFQR